MKDKYRVAKVMVPVPNDRHVYRATTPVGEVLESRDLASLFRKISENFSSDYPQDWTIVRSI